MCACPRPCSDPGEPCTCSSASCAIPGAPKESIMRKHIAKRGKDRMASSFGRQSWPYTPMEALIVSNPKVDNTHVTIENWIRNEKRGCGKRKTRFLASGRATRKLCRNGSWCEVNVIVEVLSFPLPPQLPAIEYGMWLVLCRKNQRHIEPRACICA